MDRVDELSGIAVPASVADRIRALRASGHIDYEGVAALKRELLESAFRRFYESHYLTDSQRGKAFREYLETEERTLETVFLFLRTGRISRKPALAGLARRVSFAGERSG